MRSPSMLIPRAAGTVVIAALIVVGGGDQGPPIIAASARPTPTTLVVSVPPTGREPGEPRHPRRLEVTDIQRDLHVPWDLAFTPDGRLILTERAGRIRVYASAEPYAAILSTTMIPDVHPEGEGGGMGIAVDRQFDRFPFVYVCASRDARGPDAPAPWINELLRFRVNLDSTLTLDGPPLITGALAHKHHNGCAVEMDDEDHIWVSIGDANAVRTLDLAQNPVSLNGKVLRINRDGSIPADNPPLRGLAPSAVWSMGHRNPQGIALRGDGLVLVSEHGTDRDDEVNRIVRGGNYGYGCYTGFSRLGPAQEQAGAAKDACGPARRYREPLWASRFPTIAPSNATFLTGRHWGGWEGDLIMSTLKEADLRRFEVSDDGRQIEMVETLLDEAFGRLRATVMGPDGALYITTAGGASDRVLRVVPTG